MLRIFYGNDRVRARVMAEKMLGADYEVLEAENLGREDLDSVFFGASLFSAQRKILIKALTENKECWDALPNYVETPHEVVLLENNVDKRAATYKTLAKVKSVEFKEFKLAETVDRNIVFDIFEAAYRKQGERAIKMCEQIEMTNEPFMFIGLMVSQAFKKLELRERKAPAVVKILGELDLATKTTAIDVWTLIKATLLKIANI